jgi:hypothetical protein
MKLWVEQFLHIELQQNGKKGNGGHLDEEFYASSFNI